MYSMIMTTTIVSNMLAKVMLFIHRREGLHLLNQVNKIAKKTDKSETE